MPIIDARRSPAMSAAGQKRGDLRRSPAKTGRSCHFCPGSKALSPDIVRAMGGVSWIERCYEPSIGNVGLRFSNEGRSSKANEWLSRFRDWQVTP